MTLPIAAKGKTTVTGWPRSGNLLTGTLQPCNLSGQRGHGVLSPSGNDTWGASEMDIPFYCKEDSNDCGCAPVCLKMALAYFHTEVPIKKIYGRAGSLGEVHYTLPWGICLAAECYGLCATFISKQPDVLLESSIADINVFVPELSPEDVQDRIQGQLTTCRESPTVALLEWSDPCRTLPQRLVTEETAVVIPTVWWGRQPHNVVLTDFGGDAVVYHDPNLEDGENQTMPLPAFYERWIHRCTDNDLLLISRTAVCI